MTLTIRLTFAALILTTILACQNSRLLHEMAKPDSLPPHATPVDALQAIIVAYHSGDIEQVILHRDFEIDSTLFWEDLGLPLREKDRKKSRDAFESNLRKELENDPRDYTGWKFEVISQEQVDERFTVVTLRPFTKTTEYEPLHIPVYLTDDGWKVVIHPRFDTL